MPRKSVGYVCGYTFCRHKEDKVDPENGVKDGKRYFHPECHKEKETKKQIIDLYYRYYHTDEDYKVVTRAVNDLIHKQENDAVYVLCVLCQCIRGKVPFRSIFSLSWQVKNNETFRKKYNAMIANEKVKGLTFDDVQVVYNDTLQRKPPKRKSWSSTLFG